MDVEDYLTYEKDSLTAEDVLNEYLCSKAFLFMEVGYVFTETI